MVNKARGEVEVALDGKGYALRPTFEALSEIESQTGLSVIALAERIARGNIRLSDIVTIIAVGIEAGENIKMHKNTIGKTVVNAGISAFLASVASFLNVALTGVTETEIKEGEDGA